ncbi:MAG: hypothetical protein IKX14_00895 [Neisseriaceae bacterium]|nr:hypothetical protein [Neisseriaceae bacterium]
MLLHCTFPAHHNGRKHFRQPEIYILPLYLHSAVTVGKNAHPITTPAVSAVG